MSESTSSPSNVHPVSPYSSLSPTDSAPRSEPTSDEQPDLGFNQVLREYSHFQPHPRIPIQIRSPTSSTTPTYHADSVTGSDFRVRSGRRSTQSALTSVSTFTRPPTSSVQPEGSTVWDHPFIVPYLPGTPSNDILPEEEDDYSPSESASRASTPLTVEIRDFRSNSFDDESRDSDFSPEPTSAIPIQVASDNQQIDSLDTPHTEDDIDSLSSQDRRESSMTSRDMIHRTATSSSQEQSDNSLSIQLQSQVIPVASTSTSSLSFASSDDAGQSISIAGPSAPSSINSLIDSTVGVPTSSESTSTLMNVFLNRSRNPISPRTVSDSSFSLISQLPETPSVTGIHREEFEPEMFSDHRPQRSNDTRTISSAISISLTQPSLGSSSSRSTALAQRPFNSRSNLSLPATDASLPNPHSLYAATPLTNPHSLAGASPLTNPHSLPATSPLMNPYSLAATPETGLHFPGDTSRFIFENAAQPSDSRTITFVDDLDTPDRLSRRIFEPIRDDEDEASNQHSAHLHTIQANTYETNDNRQSTGESYHPGGRTPRYLSGHTPKGIPTILTRSQATRDSQAISSEVYSLEQRPGPSNNLYQLAEASYAPHISLENGRWTSVTVATVTEESSERNQATSVDLPLRSEERSHSLPSSSSHSQEIPITQALGLHLLPSQPLVALASDSPSSANLFRENNSQQTQFPVEAGHVTDPDAEQLYAEATTSLLPSLGYLDEALSFIAAERARLTSARTTASILTGGAAPTLEQLDIENEGGRGSLRQQEGDDWRDAIDISPDGERGAESKRKRRRKRAAKQSGQALESSPTEDRNGANGSQPTQSPKKRRSKSAAPPLSSASILSPGSFKSGTVTPGRRNKYKGKEFLIPPPPPSSSDLRSNLADSDLDDGGRTPTNVPIPGLIRVPTLLGMNSTGAKGKRIGKREREKLKFDTPKSRNNKSSGDLDSFDDPIDISVDYDPNTDNDRKAEAIEDGGEGPGENDSISNMSLLQPPRRLRPQSQSKAGESSLGLVTKDNPTTTMGLQDSINFYADGISNRETIDDTAYVYRPKQTHHEIEKEKKRRTRPKPITHSRSYPTLAVDAEVADSSQLASKEPTTTEEDKMNKSDGSMEKDQVSELVGLQSQDELGSPKSKQLRLLALAQILQQLFPEQREDLARVMKRIEKHQGVPRSPQKAVVSPDTAGSSDRAFGKPMPIPVPAKGKKAKKTHARAASEGAVTTGSESLEAPHVQRPMTDVEEREEEDIDPRGRPPKRKDPLIHVFIDHSNILIGLLSHLRRASPYRKRIYIARRKALPPVVTTFTTQGKVDPVAAVTVQPTTSSRPLPTLPSIADHGSSSSGNHPIPLPSFATLPRSLPSASHLSSMSKTTDEAHSSEESVRKNAANSDRSGLEGGHRAGSVGNGGSASAGEKEKKPLKHLWHAALILILERGRPISRRVVVASSPLYQPMETIQRFDYDLRVFIRVPDQGDGMDREHNAEKGKAGSVGKTGSHAKRLLLSGSESGSGGNASGGLHPFYTKSNPGTSPGKIKYREQGVDELLQLKLHQAIAASDDVPDGSTIILATGDGNMGQFNEEGFLGPIRTALRRGWKVELYAWEDGLSRAWKREFGEDTEWGKRGRFRIIRMEQYASWLVESAEWA